MFIYELSACGFEFYYNHLDFRRSACFYQGVPWRSGNCKMKIRSKRVCDMIIVRSSRSQMFFRLGVLKNFAIFTEKQLCWSLFLIKTWRPATLLKRDSNTGVFKFLTLNLKNICKRLLLKSESSSFSHYFIYFAHCRSSHRRSLK